VAYSPAHPDEQSALLEEVVARYNDVRLVSNSQDVVKLAADMVAHVEAWIELLQRDRIDRNDVDQLRVRYDVVRKPYIDAVKDEVGLRPDAGSLPALSSLQASSKE
jgi:hypothetical protein